MNKKDINQVQFGDYFICQRGIVKMVTKSGKDEFTAETKYKNYLYAPIACLQPITINPYTLESAGFTPTDDNVFFYAKGVRVKFNRRMGVVDSISHDGACLDMAIKDFHVLQNALRLFGEEVELKQ